jgi:drug/metabolite transporter (DMT)-like permease
MYGYLKIQKGKIPYKTIFSVGLPSMAFMVLANFSLLLAFKDGPVSIISPVSAAYPLVTLGFAWIFMNEKIFFRELILSIFIFVGLFLTFGVH